MEIGELRISCYCFGYSALEVRIEIRQHGVGVGNPALIQQHPRVGLLGGGSRIGGHRLNDSQGGENVGIVVVYSLKRE